MSLPDLGHDSLRLYNSCISCSIRYRP